MKPVCIVGLGNTQSLVPWDNKDLEFWGLPWCNYSARYNRLFEMHNLQLVTQEAARRGGPKYIDRINETGVPVYMQTEHDAIPTSREYPLEDVIKAIGLDYFGSSPAYMLAMAIQEERPEIHLYGIDLTKDIYDHQRPNLEFLIGLAVGRRIPVRLPEGSRLLTLKRADRIGDVAVIYPKRYGYTGTDGGYHELR